MIKSPTLYNRAIFFHSTLGSITIRTHSVIRKLEQRIHRVPSWRQYKYKWGTTVGVVKGIRKVERWRLDKLAAGLSHHKVLDGWDHLKNDEESEIEFGLVRGATS